MGDIGMQNVEELMERLIPRDACLNHKTDPRTYTVTVAIDGYALEHTIRDMLAIVLDATAPLMRSRLRELGWLTDGDHDATPDHVPSVTVNVGGAEGRAVKWKVDTCLAGEIADQLQYRVGNGHPQPPTSAHMIH